MAECCPPGSIGAAPLCSELAVGRMETISDETAKPLPCYVTGAIWDETARLILVYTDIYGINAGLHKVVADRLASKLGTTTTVVIPDFFRGTPIVEEDVKKEDIAQQIAYHCKNRVTDTALDYDLLKVLMPWLREKTKNPGVEISCLGFCFGGWLATHTLTLSERDLVAVKCAVGLHPSYGVEAIHGRSEEDFARATGRKPILLLPARNDPLKPGNATVKILANSRSIPETELSVEFPSMLHGFVVRGDSSNEDVRKDQELALKLTVDFIEKHHSI